MDNLTHTLTGLMLARTGLDRRSPGLTLAVILASNVPDSDIIAALDGAANYLEHHRGLTHGLAMSPVMALLPVLVLWPFYRKLRFGWVYGACLLAVLCHLAMDWTNIYGIRLLTPFSERWFRLDITSVVDPWIWLVLAAGTLWPLLSRLVSSEIGARSSAGPGAAWFALLVILAYSGVRYVLHERALETLNARLYFGHIPQRVAAFPSLANPLRWIGYTETERAVQLHSVHLAKTFDPEATGDIYYKMEPSEAQAKARNTEPFRSFLVFSQFPFWREIPLAEPEGGVEVEAMDLRFGTPGEGRFSARCILAANGKVERAWFQFRPPGKAIVPR
jgi:inner membrane protein